MLLLALARLAVGALALPLARPPAATSAPRSAPRPDRPGSRPTISASGGSARSLASRHAVAQSPVAPSIRSRIRSAWPLWRAYSSIMCTMIQRRDDGLDPRRTERAVLIEGGRLRLDATRRRSQRRRIEVEHGRRRRWAPACRSRRRVGIGVVDRTAASASANARWNQPRSTSVMCRTSPSSERSTAGTNALQLRARTGPRTSCSSVAR